MTCSHFPLTDNPLPYILQMHKELNSLCNKYCHILTGLLPADEPPPALKE